MSFRTTKERIIYESLRLFSEKGYDGVSMREIAAAVEIKAASLYAHFDGKEAIYQAIVDTMKQRYNEKAMLLQIDGNNPDADVAVYENISTEQLYAIGEQSFLFFVHDEYTKMYRKMLTIEQFQNPQMAALQTKRNYADVMRFFTGLVRFLIRRGRLCDRDPEILAAELCLPISVWINLCDREPEREEEIVQLIERHIRQFFEIYQVK